MRAGRAEDLTPLIELWRREVVAGRQDMVPEETRMRRMLSRFDWEARSRMGDDGGRLAGAILLMSRPSRGGGDHRGQGRRALPHGSDVAGARACRHRVR